MLNSFQSVAALILSSSAKEIERAAEDKRLVQSMDILVELLLQYKRVQLHHVPSMVSLTDALADLIGTSSSLKKLLTK